MARRKIARSEPQTWLLSEIVSLLAWLDFTRKNPHINFEDTIVGELNNKYTLQKVKYRLNKLWIDHGPDVVPAGTTAKGQYDTLGSRALHDDRRGLDDSIKEQIAEALAALEARYHNVSLQASLSPSRRLRSNSRFDSKQPDDSGSPRTIYDVDGEEEQMIWRQRSGTRLRSSKTTEPGFKETRTSSSSPATGEKRKGKWAVGAHLETTPRAEMGLVRAQKKKLLRGNISSTTKSHLSTAIGRPIPTRRQRSMTIYDSEQSPSNSEHEEQKVVMCSPNVVRGGKPRLQKNNEAVRGSKEETTFTSKERDDWICCDKCDLWQETKDITYTCEQCLTPAASARSQIHSGTQAVLPCIDCDDRLRGAVMQIEALQSQVREKDSELLGLDIDIQNMERKISTLKGAQEQRDAQAGRPIEAEMTNLLEQRDKLQRDLTDRMALGTFTRLDRNPPPRREVRGITDKLADAYRYIDKCIVGIDNLKIVPDPQLGQLPDLEGLVHNALGAPKTETTEQFQSLWQTSSAVVLRALMSSAVRDWVFYSDFPSFDGDTSPSLRIYRECIAKSDGPLALRNLDLASMERLISEPVFHNITIPDESGRLANRLSVALAPLFQEDSISTIRTGWDGFATWQSSVEEAKDRQDCLTRMFAYALKAKADSCLNTKWYEMVIFTPGTLYDPKTMLVQTMDGMKVPFARHTHGKVHVCVEPALFAFPREDPSYIDNISDCIMSGRNFKTQEERKFEPLMKAVVVLA